MNMFSYKITPLLKNVGILPVVCLKNQNELDTFIKALLPTPIRCIEITLRHPFAPTSISYIKKHYPQFTVGAGTVTTHELLDQAINSGADFCVSPGFDSEIIEKAFQKNILFLPGCSTPSEILAAKNKGILTVKLFPAECSGGVKALQLYEGAFADISFLPTGGITKDNYLQYLELKNVIACGGSFMIPKEMLTAWDIEGIYNTVTECITAIGGKK